MTSCDGQVTVHKSLTQEICCGTVRLTQLAFGKGTANWEDISSTISTPMTFPRFFAHVKA